MHSYMVRYNQPRVEEALTQLKAGSAQTRAVGPLERLGRVGVGLMPEVILGQCTEGARNSRYLNLFLVCTVRVTKASPCCQNRVWPGVVTKFHHLGGGSWGVPGPPGLHTDPCLKTNKQKT